MSESRNIRRFNAKQARRALTASKGRQNLARPLEVKVPMMNTILCMKDGERRPVKVYQLGVGGPHLDCEGLTRLGYKTEVFSDADDAIEVIATETGWLLEAHSDTDEGTVPFLIRATLTDTTGEVIATGGLMVMLVPQNWRGLADLALAPGEVLAEGQTEPGLIQVVGG